DPAGYGSVRTWDRLADPRIAPRVWNFWRVSGSGADGRLAGLCLLFAIFHPRNSVCLFYAGCGGGGLALQANQTAAISDVGLGFRSPSWRNQGNLGHYRRGVADRSPLHLRLFPFAEAILANLPATGAERAGQGASWPGGCSPIGVAKEALHHGSSGFCRSVGVVVLLFLYEFSSSSLRLCSHLHVLVQDQRLRQSVRPHQVLRLARAHRDLRFRSR